MIRTEAMVIGDTAFVRTYSDSGFMIHGGSPEANYSEAIDPVEFNRQYTETDIPIDADETEELLAILTGESE